MSWTVSLFKVTGEESVVGEHAVGDKASSGERSPKKKDSSGHLRLLSRVNLGLRGSGFIPYFTSLYR
jgi:hypothetical protein